MCYFKILKILFVIFIINLLSSCEFFNARLFMGSVIEETNYTNEEEIITLLDFGKIEQSINNSPNSSKNVKIFPNKLYAQYNEPFSFHILMSFYFSKVIEINFKEITMSIDGADFNLLNTEKIRLNFYKKHPSDNEWYEEPSSNSEEEIVLAQLLEQGKILVNSKDDLILEDDFESYYINKLILSFKDIPLNHKTDDKVNITYMIELLLDDNSIFTINHNDIYFKETKTKEGLAPPIEAFRN